MFALVLCRGPCESCGQASLPSAEPGKLAGQVTLCCLEMLARGRTVRALIPFPSRASLLSSSSLHLS